MRPDSMLVAPESLSAALQEVGNRGPKAALRHLRRQEPMLASFVQEKLAAILGRLALTGAPPPVVRGVYRETLFLVLGSLQALRRGHYALWQDTVPADRLPVPDMPEPEQKATEGPEEGKSEIPF